jgi:hypothetical protein
MNFSGPTKAVFAFFFLSLALWTARFYGRLPAITDVFLFTYPSQSVNQMEFAKGFVPLWDAYTGCGTPQLANSLSACAYPPFWLWRFTGLSQWLVWMALLHSGWAFAGFYFWARSQKIYPLWAALGALSFAGSLHMVRCWGYPVFSAAQSWTPWIFGAAARWLESGRARWWMALAASISLQVLAGYPFFSFYALLFLVVWALFQSCPLGRKKGLFVALPAAFGLSAVQWLPFLDSLGYSTRGGAAASPEHFAYFTKPLEFLTLLSPTALGRPETDSYLGTTANANFMLYFGLIPLIAWIGGILFQKFEGRIFWGSASLAWFLWLAGSWFPLWRVFPEAGLEWLNPSKAVGVFIFAACTCGGLALTRFFRDRWDDKKRSAIFWVVGALWMLDLLSLPYRMMHPVLDPYRKPEIRDWAEGVKKAAEGGRALSFKAHGKTKVYGTEDSGVFGAAADDWVDNLLANSMAVWGIRESQAYLSTWTVSMDKFWRAFNQMETYGGALPDIAGVKTLFLPLQLSPAHYQVLGREGEGYLMQNKFSKGDAWPAYGEKFFPDQEAILGALLKEQTDPKKSQELILEEGITLPPPARSLPYSPGGGLSGWSRACGSRARYSGAWSGQGWLAWNEAFTPGWRAWVDGTPVLIHRAYGFFMAVPLPGAGEHQVDFRYEPSAFRLGLFISLIFLAMGTATAGLKSFNRVGTISTEAQTHLMKSGNDLSMDH